MNKGASYRHAQLRRVMSGSEGKKEVCVVLGRHLTLCTLTPATMACCIELWSPFLYLGSSFTNSITINHHPQSFDNTSGADLGFVQIEAYTI